MVKNEEIKSTLFADNMTCFLNDINLYLQLCRLLEDLYKYSGFWINNDKTELFAIGSIKLTQHDFIHNVRTSIKILGTFFNHPKPSWNKADFESIFKSIQRTLNMWKWRGLTWKDSNSKNFYHTKVFE